MARNRRESNGPVDAAGIAAQIPPCMSAGDEGTLNQAPPWVRPQPSVYHGFDSASDPVFKGNYPTLYAFLTLVGYEGKQRKAGSVSVFCQEGKFKACLNDNDGGFLAFVSADSFTGLLDALEKGLTKGGLDWRKMKWKR